MRSLRIVVLEHVPAPLTILYQETNKEQMLVMLVVVEEVRGAKTRRQINLTWLAAVPVHARGLG